MAYVVQWFTLTLTDPAEYAPPHLSTCGQEQIQIPKCSVPFGIEDSIQILKTAMLHVKKPSLEPLRLKKSLYTP